MDLQIHDVRELSMEGGYVYGDGGTDIGWKGKKIKIKINGYDNYITLYCEHDAKVSITGDIVHRRNEGTNTHRLNLWPEDEARPGQLQEEKG